MSNTAVQQVVDAAMAHHQAGRLPQAERLYRQALALEPAHGQATHFLGMLLHQAGRDDLAVPLMRRSIELDGEAAHYCTNLAEVLRGMGWHEEAAALCRRAIALQPQFPEAHSCLANALGGLGRGPEAVQAYRRALELRPGFGTAWNNLGTALQDLGDNQEAARCYRKAIVLMPAFSAAYGNLGGVLRELGQLAEAEALTRKAVALDPKNVQALNALGNTLKALGRWDEAEQSYRRAIELNPRMAAAHTNLGNLLKDRCQLAAAAACYRQAIELQQPPAAPPPQPPPQADSPEAGRYDRAIGGPPQGVAALNNLGNVFKDQGKIPEALACFRQALAARPDYADAHSSLLLTLHYDGATPPEEIFAQHLRYAAIHEQPLQATLRPHVVDRSAERRLRVGYLSPDFRQHAVATFLEPILAHHDHERFEVVRYCDVLRPDATTQRLRGLADDWHSVVGMTDEQVAQKIRQDRIDILVDLAGHTANNRLRSLAHKPAPVQMTYLGYPDTTGLRAVDYRITDAEADPPGLTESLHTERLVRVAAPFLCYSAPGESPEVNDLPSLQRGWITFGSFNNFAKVTAGALEQWARLLQMQPDSHLLLKAPSLGDPGVRESVQAFLAQRGIGLGRVELVGYEPSYGGHLSHYHRVDVALDTFPYCGTTTTCEALWMGVPVVSLVGRTHVSRVGVSLLKSVGLGELAADSPQAYVQAACSLAGDRQRLRELRCGLRARMKASPLMDGQRLAAEVERVYAQAWRGARVR